MNVTVEITQNMSPTEMIEQTLFEDGTIITAKKSGDFVTCNLSSIHLGNAYRDNVFERLIPIQVRMLDNVIDLNTISVLQAKHTNRQYRSIGLGTFDLHHLLAVKRLQWGSPEAIEFNDRLYEKINFLAIVASMNLAKEKGAYPLFKGSDWDTGDYFRLRKYGTYELDNEKSRYLVEEDWSYLWDQVNKHGIRNANIMAVAPNGSTSILVNGTASIDPIFQQVYSEEKKDYKIKVVVPELNPATSLFYENAYMVSQIGSVDMCAARQRHIDQSQSFNLYVDNGIKASELLNILLHAWKSKLKTIYYVRSTSIDIIDCDNCSS